MCKTYRGRAKRPVVTVRSQEAPSRNLNSYRSAPVGVGQEGELPRAESCFLLPSLKPSRSDLHLFTKCLHGGLFVHLSLQHDTSCHTHPRPCDISPSARAEVEPWALLHCDDSVCSLRTYSVPSKKVRQVCGYLVVDKPPPQSDASFCMGRPLPAI
jgi:hypothetical protein